MIQPLFQIELFHSWFKNGKFDHCQIVPDTNTQEILSRYRLMMQMRDAKFELYCVFHDNLEALLKVLNQILNGSPLKFLLKFKPDQFSYITDFAFDWVGKISFSSRNSIQDDIEGKINLNYTLESELKPLIQPVFSQKTNFEENVVAEISIYPENLLSAKRIPVQYSIHFKTRIIHWYYYLINRSQTKLIKPFICNADGLCFNEPELITMPNGETALGFSSGDLQFPLQQVPSFSFNLIDRLSPLMQTNTVDIEHCLIKGLPTPKPGQLLMKESEGSSLLVSHMYIHL